MTEINRQLVEPRTLKGFQDLLPEDLIPRKAVICLLYTSRCV